jgi:pyruvate decarboxylase
VEEITERFSKAEKPIVIVDACAGRFGMASTVRELVETCNIRFFESESTPVSVTKIVLTDSPK